MSNSRTSNFSKTDTQPIYFINNQQTTKRALFILLMRPVSYKMGKNPHNYFMSSGLEYTSLHILWSC